MADNTTKSKFKLQVKAQTPEFRSNIADIQKKANYGNRQDDTTIVNSDGANASVRLTDNKVNIASSQDSGIKVNEQQANFQSFEEKHTTNRFSLDTYEVIINGHKLNPNLWEYADMSEFKDQYTTRHAVGGLCIFGTVMCPTWDEQLHKYMLVRRLTRMPLFSPKLNVPEIMKALDIEDPTKVSYEYGYKQTTESAEEFQKKAAAKMKAEEDGKDGDAPEQGANGRHLSEDEIKKKMDENKGMTREQAVEEIKKDEKYTKPWEAGKGYLEGDEAKAAQEKIDAQVNEKDAKDGDAKNGEKGPNGRMYFENDIKYLTDNNKDMTREQAIDILSKDKKYTDPWEKGKGYKKEEKAADKKTSGSTSSSSNASGGSSSSSSSSSTQEAEKAPSGKPYAKDEDISWEVGELGKQFDKIDSNFKNQVTQAMVSQVKTYGPARAVKHILTAKSSVNTSLNEANKQYAQWLNDIAYYLGTIEYKSGSVGGSSQPVPQPKPQPTEQKVEKTTKVTKKNPPVTHAPADTQSQRDTRVTTPRSDNGSTFKNKPTPKTPEPAPQPKLQQQSVQKQSDKEAQKQKELVSMTSRYNKQQIQVFSQMLQKVEAILPNHNDSSKSEVTKMMLSIRNAMNSLNWNATLLSDALPISKLPAQTQSIIHEAGIEGLNQQLQTLKDQCNEKIKEIKSRY